MKGAQSCTPRLRFLHCTQRRSSAGPADSPPLAALAALHPVVAVVLVGSPAEPLQQQRHLRATHEVCGQGASRHQEIGSAACGEGTGAAQQGAAESRACNLRLSQVPIHAILDQAGQASLLQLAGAVEIAITDTNPKGKGKGDTF